MFDRLSEDQRQVLNIVPEGHNVFITGQGGTARKNNRLLSSICPAGEGGFGQMMYRSTILACLFSVGVRISWKTLCWKGAWRRKWHLVSPTLYIIIVYTVNLNKLSRNFVGALGTTTINCRVSFLDLYLVFPRNFRIIFLPHTNTVILLEPYCGSITEPGLPVVIQKLPRFPASHIAFTRCSFNVLGMILSVCQFWCVLVLCTFVTPGNVGTMET